MRNFLFGMICGAILLFVVMHYHIVRGNQGIVLVPKISNNLSDVYCDIREYNLDDWRKHKPLAAAIMRSNQDGLIEETSQNALGRSLRGAMDSLFKQEQ